MLTITTTAINRPSVLESTMDSLHRWSDVSRHDTRWIVNVDCVIALPDAEAAFERTVEIARGYERPGFRVVLHEQRPAGGAPAALTRLRELVEDVDAVLMLEDDWMCHPDCGTGQKLNLARHLDELDEYAYVTLRGTHNLPSFRPSLVRGWNFRRASDGLHPNIDAEAQYLRHWAAAQRNDPAGWQIAPELPCYFADLGRAWIQDKGLAKWSRPVRYTTPVTYNVTEISTEPGIDPVPASFL